MTPKQLEAAIDHLLVGEVIDNARIEAIQLLAEAAAKHAGIQSMDGLSIRDWVEKEKRERLKKKMFMLEDLDPAHAARLQTILSKVIEITDKRQKKDEEA